MVELLRSNPLILLFLVAAVGYPLGYIKVRNTSLGVSSVLFTGLVVGALHPDFRLPEIINQIGLALFVYTLGLSSGNTFFAALRRRGLKLNLFAICMLLLGLGITFICFKLTRLQPFVAAGVFCGSLTNTPALASVLEYLKESAPTYALEQLLAHPVVGYSVTYPIGLLGMVATIAIVQRIWKIDYHAEALALKQVRIPGESLQNLTIRITNVEATRHTISELLDKYGWDISFGRLKRNGRIDLAVPETRLAIGDLVSIIGSKVDVANTAKILGEVVDEHLEMDRSRFDFRRIFVSNPKVAGHTLEELNLPQQFGAIVTRIRRGDVEMVPQDQTVLELGDRVRVVTRRENMDALTRFFGDSYKAASELDFLTFSLGLVVGLVIGLIPIPITEQIHIKLGLAGGPLIIALVLGSLERTGSLVWVPPYAANMALRQIGLIFFLAGVGTQSGYKFISTLSQEGGLEILATGTIVTCTVALLTLVIGYKLLKIPMGSLLGVLAGIQTQPALLSFALTQTENELPNIGYATVFPVAMITKIILVQIFVLGVS